jgi:cytochrome c biogenesis protein CcmG/thiol:disulfide interchange protein DsbE
LKKIPAFLASSASAVYTNTFESLHILPGLLLLGVLLAACDPQSVIQANAPAAAFTLQKLDGGPVHFPDQHRGQIVAIHFWANWCPHCLGEMPALDPVYRQYRDQGLVFLAINVLEKPDAVRAFIKTTGVSYEVLLDPEGEVMRRYGAMGLPATFMVDRQGIIRSRVIGESTPEVFESMIKKLL